MNLITISFLFPLTFLSWCYRLHLIQRDLLIKKTLLNHKEEMAVFKKVKIRFRFFSYSWAAFLLYFDNIAYVDGFRMVPLRLLILVMTNKSLNRKSARSFRAPEDQAIVIRSCRINALSEVTRFPKPSIKLSNSQSVSLSL